jgi:hypothetical protein
MAITIMAIQQALYADVTIAALVVEDGFLDIDQGLQWITYWVRSLFPQLSIPIVRGYPRGAYLNATRVFPAAWVSAYTGLLDVNYPGWSSFAAPAPETPDQLAAALLGVEGKDRFFSVLSIGPTTTMPVLFDRYPDLLGRTKYVTFELGSITPTLMYPGERGGRGRAGRAGAGGGRAGRAGGGRGGAGGGWAGQAGGRRGGTRWSVGRRRPSSARPGSLDT